MACRFGSNWWFEKSVQMSRWFLLTARLPKLKAGAKPFAQDYLAVRHKRSAERRFTCENALSLALSLQILHKELQDISHKQTTVVIRVSGLDSKSIQRAEANTEGSWEKNQVLASESLPSSYIAYDCDTSHTTRNIGTPRRLGGLVRLSTSIVIVIVTLLRRLQHDSSR